MMDLAISVKGEVVSSNLPAFQDFIKDRLAQVNMEPQNDLEFGKAEEDWKELKAVEKAIKEKTGEALKQAESLNALFETLGEVSKNVRDVRLKLEKAVKERKESVRQDCVEKGITKFQVESKLLPAQAATIRADLVEAVKGKKTVKTMNSAIDVVVKTWTGRVHSNQCVIEEFLEADPKFHGPLLSDRQTLELSKQSPDALASLLGERAEKARLRIENEEAKAREKAALEAKEKAEHALKEKDNPPEPPKPTSSSQIELRDYIATVRSAFAPIKDAAAKLIHEKNQNKARAFAAAVNQAWGELTK